MARRRGSLLLGLAKQYLRPITPRSVLSWRQKRAIESTRQYFRQRSTEETFTEIYSQNLWGGSEGTYCSGDGSTVEFASVYCRAVRQFITENGIKSVVDLGCGDFRVGRSLVSSEFQYTGIDIVVDLVRRNEAEFGTPSVRFLHRNIIEDELPDGELCLIRQVLQHLSNDQVLSVLDNCQKYKYLIVTEHYPDPNLPVTPNRDKPHGPDTRVTDQSGLFLDLPPFNRAIIGTLCEVQSRGDRSVIRTMVVESNALRKPSAPAGTQTF